MSENKLILLMRTMVKRSSKRAVAITVDILLDIYPLLYKVLLSKCEGIVT